MSKGSWERPELPDFLEGLQPLVPIEQKNETLKPCYAHVMDLPRHDVPSQPNPPAHVKGIATAFLRQV